MWTCQIAELSIDVRDPYYFWLTGPFRLSTEFEKISGALRVDVLSQQFEIVPDEEQAVFNTLTPCFSMPDFAAPNRMAALQPEVLSTAQRACLARPSFQDPPWVRRVFLRVDEVPLCYAKVVVPLLTYQTYQPHFTALQTQLLGMRLLYAAPTTRRSVFQYAKILKPHPLFLAVQQALSTGTAAFQVDYFWARRSVFWMEGRYPLLDTEVFLPALNLHQVPIP